MGYLCRIIRRRLGNQWEISVISLKTLNYFDPNAPPVPPHPQHPNLSHRPQLQHSLKSTVTLWIPADSSFTPLAAACIALYLHKLTLFIRSGSICGLRFYPTVRLVEIRGL